MLIDKIVRVEVGRNMGKDIFFQYFINKEWIRDRPIDVQIIENKTPLFENRCDKS